MMGDWTFFSNYGHVLFCLAQNNETRLRDVAAEVGITERAVQKIVRDLQDAGYLTVEKHGRRNRYKINKRRALRHSLESHCNVGKLLALVERPEPETEEPETEESGPEPPEMKTDPMPTPPPKTEESVQKSEPEDIEKEPEPSDTREQGSLF
jgi:DNA-binding Lrp family transcriptional regulator